MRRKRQAAHEVTSYPFYLFSTFSFLILVARFVTIES
jgi:hypothetical protein